MQRHANIDPLLEESQALRVLVVADDPLVREGFAARIGAAAVGEVHRDRLEPALERLAPNLLLWDLGPHGASLSVPEFESLRVPVVALLAPGVEALPLLAAGAGGVLPRNAAPAALVHAMHTVLEGLLVIEPALLANTLEGATAAESTAPTEVTALTAREREVLELMASGLSNRRIGERLGISAHTAKFHIAAIMEKLDADTRTEAVVRAVQRGWMLL